MTIEQTWYPISMDTTHPTPSFLSRVRAQEDQTLMADALEHYADAMRLASEHIPVGAGTRNLRKRITRSRELATIINQVHHG